MAEYVVEFGKDGRPVEPDGRLDAAAFHRNHAPIWAVLEKFLGGKSGDVLEAGSGTGQHVVHFARHTPGITWWPSDFNEAHLKSIEAWRAHAGLANIRPPLAIDLTDPAWCRQMTDGSGPPQLRRYSAPTSSTSRPGASPRACSPARAVICRAAAASSSMAPSSATASTRRCPTPCSTPACARAIRNGACATSPTSSSSPRNTGLRCRRRSRCPPII